MHMACVRLGAPGRNEPIHDKAERTEKGWSQAELAVSRQTDNAIETGRLFRRGIEDIFTP